ncbi:MAG: hypothetical protein KKH72_10790 [Alphaproteobacteria bacterium]|nr:hypothetical protein [Alphaproteobacteria bacterium]
MLFAALGLGAGLSVSVGFAAPVEVEISFTVTDEVSPAYDVFADAVIGGDGHQLHVAQCDRVQLDGSSDDSLVTPVVCDGERLSFAMTEAGIAVLRDGEKLSEIGLEPGRYFVNGLPRLVE